MVQATYALQGFGYAAVVTALPNMKARYHFDDSTIAVIVLLVAIGAVIGSMLADRIAVLYSSKVALIFGLTVEALTLFSSSMPFPVFVFIGLLAVYGVGLGAMDASLGMQAVIAQRRLQTSVMGSFFACYTAAAIGAALLMSLAARNVVLVSGVLCLASVTAIILVLLGRTHFDPETHKNEVGNKKRHPLPRVGIWCFGAVIFAAFALDSAVSTWSTIYLSDSLNTGPSVAPLGYAAYQLGVLLTRFVVDRIVLRWGRQRLALSSTIIAICGCGLIAFIADPVMGIMGFTLVGVGVGALVPLAFSGAGELDSLRSDEVIARVNLFNYAGAILGAVFLGLLSDPIGLGHAFLLPGLSLFAIFVLRGIFSSDAHLLSNTRGVVVNE
ncbi:MAG: MFS transporter [Mycobacteriaceae bacterium]